MAGLGFVPRSEPVVPPPPPPVDSSSMAPRVFHVNPHLENLSAANFLELCKQHKIETSYVPLRVAAGFIPPPSLAKPLADEHDVFDDYKAAIEAMRKGEPVVDGACRLLRRSSGRDRDRDYRSRSRSSRRDRSPGLCLFVCLFVVCWFICVFVVSLYL